MLALLAIPGYPILASGAVYSLLYLDSRNGRGDLDVLDLPTLVIAVLVGLAIWHSSRQLDDRQVRTAN